MKKSISTEKTVIVMGCDVGPAKGITLWNGNEFRFYPVPRLQDFPGIKDAHAADKEQVLMAWDAPLTGPPSIRTDALRKGDLTIRKIESFFGSSKREKPEGISVQGYASCQHWTITQHLFGLPRVGLHTKPPHRLPVCLISESRNGRWTGFTDGRPALVEVHPAVSIWLWCREELKSKKDWKYKGGRNKKAEEGNRLAFWNILKRKFEDPVLKREYRLPHDDEIRESDDKLDAFIAWIQARLWVDGCEKIKVTLLGDSRCGSFLVPEEPGLLDSFRDFRRSPPSS